jgi:hypothetical protein
MILQVKNSTLSIELSREDQKAAAIDFLFRFSDWDRNFFVENSQVKRTIVMHTTHSFEMEEIVRDATTKDLQIWAALQLLRSM